MSAVLDKFQQAQNDVLARIRELEPAVQEYEELKRIAERLQWPDDALAGAPRSGSVPVARMRRQASSRRAGSDGGRRHDIRRIVAERPGVTINQLGKELAVDPTGLYRPVRALVRDGEIHKQGPNLYPKTVASLHQTPDAA